MLIVSRKKNESILIQNNIEVVILDIQGDKVRIGIEAPNDIKIMRSELLETENVNKEATRLPNKTELKKIKDILKKHR